MHSEGYNRAVEIAIEACERGEGPDTWDAWTEEVRYTTAEDTYVPTPEEEREARDFFQDRAIEAFEEWVEGLDDTSFTEVTRAIRTLRNAVLRYNCERCEWDEPLAMTDLLELF